MRIIEFARVSPGCFSIVTVKRRWFFWTKKQMFLVQLDHGVSEIVMPSMRDGNRANDELHRLLSTMPEYADIPEEPPDNVVTLIPKHKRP